MILQSVQSFPTISRRELVLQDRPQGLLEVLLPCSIGTVVFSPVWKSFRLRGPYIVCGHIHIFISFEYQMWNGSPNKFAHLTFGFHLFLFTLVKKVFHITTIPCDRLYKHYKTTLLVAQKSTITKSLLLENSKFYFSELFYFSIRHFGRSDNPILSPLYTNVILTK